MSPVTAPALEEAADELARLDTTCIAATACASEALRIAVVARLAPGSAIASVRQLAALGADPLAEDRAPDPLVNWEAFVAEEERRARGGAPLSVARLRRLAMTPALTRSQADSDDRDATHAIDALLREAAGRRPALERAAEVVARLSAEIVHIAPATVPTAPESDSTAPASDPTAAVSDSHAAQRALAEVAAALVLVGAGRTDRVRLLPFADAAPAERALALTAWHNGEPDHWRELAFTSLARSARTLRRSVEQLRSGAPEIDARLDTLGRASISARATVAVLRDSFAITMPTLAERLDLSRPAAADALERLVALGVATEVTGRKRDRVYAYDAALSVAEAAAAS